MTTERTDLLGETRVELVHRARNLGIPEPERMTKDQLIAEIEKCRTRDNDARRELGQPG